MRYYIAPHNFRPHWATHPSPKDCAGWMIGMNFRLYRWILRNSDMYVLSALVPGLKADDITISLEQEVFPWKVI